MAIDPWVILLEKFSAVLAFAQEDFLATRVRLCIPRDVVDAPLIHSPAIVFLIVFRNLFNRVSNKIWILHQWLHPERLHQEITLRLTIFDGHFDPLHPLQLLFILLTCVLMLMCLG